MIDAELAETSGPSRRRLVQGDSVLERYGLTWLDVALPCAVAITMTAYTPFFRHWRWAPQYLVLLALVLPGLVGIWSLVRQRNVAARWALGLIGWSAICALLSDNVIGSMIGTVDRNISVLTWAAGLGIWALAQRLSSAGRRLAVAVVLVAIAFNAVAATMQVLLQTEGSRLALKYGRAVGLTSNPVLLGALGAAGAVICLEAGRRFPPRRAVWPLAGVFFFAWNVSLSGSRVALAGCVGIAAGLAVWKRDRLQLLNLVVCVAGVVFGSVLARTLGRAVDSISRLSDTSSDGRAEPWRAGLEAAADHPVFGSGLGQFRLSIQNRLSTDFVAAMNDSQTSWIDSHNIAVTIVVALGLPGLIIALGFIYAAFRQASGPFLLVSVVIGLTYLLESMSLATFPLAMFALGVARTPLTSGNGDPDEPKVLTEDDDEVARSLQRVMGALFVVGLAAAGWLGVAEYRLDRAFSAGDPDQVDAAVSMYLGDANVLELSAQFWTLQARANPAATNKVLDLRHRIVEREPTRSVWWSMLAGVQLDLGQIDDAEQSARRSLELQATHIEGWKVLCKVADARGDAALLSEAIAALGPLGVPMGCEEES